MSGHYFRSRYRFGVVAAAVGWYEIAAGAFGTMSTVWAGAHRDAVLPGGPLLASAPFVAAIVAGIQLIQGRPRSAIAVAVLNAAQLFYFSLGGFVWKFVAGGQLSFAIDAQGPQIFAGFASTFLIGIRAHREPAVIGLNIVPIIVILCLLGSRPRALWRQGIETP